MIRILIVDDHPAILEGLRAILAPEPEFRVVGEAESGDEAMRIVRQAPADVVLLDLRLPTRDGFDTCFQLIRIRPALRVVALTAFTDEGSIASAFSAGARGFVLKGSPPALVREAIRAVAAGGFFIDSRVGDRVLAHLLGGRPAPSPYGLTRREISVLGLFPTGLSNREIGLRLGISEETVRTHARSIRKKLGARDRAQAAARALREGLVPNAEPI